MKLLPKQYYLFVDSNPDLGVDSYSVRITSNLKSLLRSWSASSRISPLWQLRPTLPDGITPSDEIHEPISIWFLHGTSAEFLRDELKPEDLARLYHDSMWLSLGAHSLVLVCRDQQNDDALKDICATRGVPYERWQVEHSDAANHFSGHKVDIEDPSDYSVVDDTRSGELASEAFSNASIEADDALGFMQLELYALLAVIEGRARGPFSVFADDAMQIEALASDLIIRNGRSEEGDEEESLQRNGGLNRPDVLLTLNAGLSRLSSQALSGTSPILRTECHFWPHSLLGIGVANLALRNVTAFISSLTQHNSYDQRVFALRETDFDISSYEIEVSREGFPDYACIDRLQISESKNLDSIDGKTLEDYISEEGETTTPITYFSGRDGFMNGVFTTSAPLPSVSGANSYQWNLGTITHEISHRILSGHLVECVEDFLEDMLVLQDASATNWKSVFSYFQSPPETYAEYASRMVGRTLLLLNCLDFDESDMKKAMVSPFDFFFEASEHFAEEIEELLVHIFDYYHFYGEDPKKYCDFIWLSWAVQPSIEQKLSEYIKRTLIALGVKHIARENWKDLAIAEFRSVLKEEPLISRLHLCSEVEEMLKSETELEEIHVFLDIAKNLLLLFHMYFKLDQLQTDASEELYSNPESRTLKRNGTKEKRYYNYRNSTNTFVSENPAVPRPRFSNPLMFLRDFSREARPSAAQSAWLLHMLAFNVDFKRTAEGTAE